MGRRHLDPIAGRFLEPDSAEWLEPRHFVGINPYVYCLNDPIDYEDPSGEVIIHLLALGFFIGAALGAGSSAIGQGLTKGWDKIDGWQVLFDAGIGGIGGLLSFSGLGLGGMVLANGALGFAGSVGGDLIASKGDFSGINWAKAGTMAGINGILSFFAGPGVQNKKKIGEAFYAVSASYRAIITASKRYGAGRGFTNTLRLQGTRCLMDAALFVPKILAGNAFVATLTMATTAVATTLFNWGADRYFDWWW